MPDDPTPQFHAITPIFTVGDLPAALAWYQHVLGFELGWTWGEPAQLASVCRDAVELNLACAPASSGTISRVYIRMRDVDAFSRRVVAAGATVTVPLADRAYGMRDFRVVDPAGNELSFGEPLP